MSLRDRQRSRVDDRFGAELRKTQRSTDRAFAVLLALQWFFCLGCALLISPQTWSGADSSVHVHVWLAVGFGGLVAGLPIALALLSPGAYHTRLTVAAAQALMSGLIIHLMSGRIEAHFHVFGVLAFLSFYRDRSVYLPMVGIVAVDHIIRGIVTPESIYGIESPTLLRSLEHSGWVLYETLFLVYGISESRRDLYATCQLQCELEEERNALERGVAARTSDLNDALQVLKVHMETLDRVQGRVEFGVDGTVIYANPFFCEVLGYTPGEVVGQHHSLLVAPGYEKTEAYAEFWRRLRAGEVQSGEYMRIAKDGDDRWLSATYTPVSDESGSIFKIVKYATDITERVRASEKSNEASRKARELARLVTESPNEVYIVNQASCRFEEVNDGAVESTGYERVELVSMALSDVAPELTAERLLELTIPLNLGEISTVDFKSQIQRKDGSTYPVQVSLHIAIYNNTPVYVAFVADVTHLEQLELRLSQAQKLESIGQLAAGVAHEINTPMQFIGDNIEYLSTSSDKIFRVVDACQQLLNDSFDSAAWDEQISRVRELTKECRFDRLREQVPSAIEESLEGVRRTVKIVRAMKDFSHPGARDKTPCVFNRLVESTIAISRNRWKHAAKIELELDPDLPEAPMLSSEINQVLLNLIVNACDAIAERYPGRDDVPGRIFVRTSFDADHILAEVEDNGCGMPAHVQRKVFDPFFTTKDVGMGTGQGLAITHNVIVNMHRGDVSVASEEGEGTTFTLRLPRNESKPRELPEESRAAQTVG